MNNIGEQHRHLLVECEVSYTYKANPYADCFIHHSTWRWSWMVFWLRVARAARLIGSR